LIIAYSSKTLPYTLWLLRSFFQSIPVDIEESAFVDGATRAQTLARIVFPLALPGIIATSVFSLIVCWNEYVFALLFLSTETKKTIPIGLRSFLTEHGNLWQYIFPLSVASSIPLLLFFLYIQRRLLQTLAGGVKG
jgi:ABC-type glycerol-3-phosphate transport system permease component